MIRLRTLVLLAALALAVLAIGLPARAEAFAVFLPDVAKVRFGYPVTWATVTNVVDGDTFWADLDGDGTGDVKVRPIGWDAPETTWGKDECYGREATARARGLVDGQRVALEKDVSETDRYDRLLRYVYTARGEWLGGVMVQEGYAKAKAYPPDTRYVARLESFQDLAQAQAAGGWGACGW